jgi:large subunit ribosomal protein L25
MKTITIEGQLRTELGKQAARQIRSEGNVPGVIYGGAQEVSFSAPVFAFKTLVYTPNFQFAEIKLDGKIYKCILKDIQFDKVTDRLNHVDFMELVEDKKVVANIPLRFTGVPSGVKDGGKLITKMKSLKVKTLPKFLKENIEVDLSNLALNGNVRVEDVKEKDFEILNPPRIPIASCVLTRELKQEETAATATPVAGAAAAPGVAGAGQPAGAAGAAATAAPAPKATGKK